LSFASLGGKYLRLDLNQLGQFMPDTQEEKLAKTIKVLASFLFLYQHIISLSLLLAHYFTFTSITFFAASALEPPTKI
jgi:hypothetical protein